MGSMAIATVAIASLPLLHLLQGSIEARMERADKRRAAKAILRQLEREMRAESIIDSIEAEMRDE